MKTISSYHLGFKVFNNQKISSNSYISPLIKICGFTRIQDVQDAVNLGVNAIGLVFYPHSARYVDLKLASQLIKYIPPHIQIVALFVNAALDYIQHLCNNLPIDLLQFHGNENASICEEYTTILKKPYIKALTIDKNINLLHFDLDKFIVEMKSYKKASGFLLDTKTCNYGGSGTSFDWNIIPPTLWQQREKPLILSGGININNLPQALNLQPYAIDISSGVEISKGIKDVRKMQQIMQFVRT